jgi:hypothetical protein
LTGKGKFRLVACLLLLGTAALLAIILRPTEPAYRGKNLTEWGRLYSSALYSSASDLKVRADVGDALRIMGTNSLPWLLQWISGSEDRSIRMIIIALLQKTPFVIKNSSVVSGVRTNLYWDQGNFAVFGFQILGSQARSAIPALVAMMKGQDILPSIHAAAALGFIGADSIPVLLAALEDPKQPNRVDIVYALANAGSKAGGSTETVIGALVRCTRDRDERVASAGVAFLGVLAMEPETSLPALTAILEDTQSKLRTSAAMAIGRFGHRGLPALAALKRCLNDPEPTISALAENIIHDIEVSGLETHH